MFQFSSSPISSGQILKKLIKYSIFISGFSFSTIFAVSDVKAAVLGFNVFTDNEHAFNGNFYLNNAFDIGSTMTAGANWFVQVAETRSIPTGSPINTPVEDTITLRTAHNNAPHGEAFLQHPDVSFSRFAEVSLNLSPQVFPHEDHSDIRNFVSVPFTFPNGSMPTNTCNQGCINNAVRAINVSLVHTPEPITILGLFMFGGMGLLSFRRKT